MNDLTKRPHFVQEVKRVPGLSNFLGNLHTKAVATRSKRVFNPAHRYPNFPGAPARRLAQFIPLYVNALSRNASVSAGPNVNMGNTEAAERRARNATRARRQANANQAAGQRIAEQAARNAAAEAARLRRAAQEANARARANAVNANRRRAAAERAAARARNAAARNAAAAQAARNAAAAAAAAERAHKAQTNAAAANAARQARAHANAAARAAAGGAGGSAGTNAARNAGNAATRAEAEENARKAENEKLSKATNNLSGSSLATLSHNTIVNMRRQLHTVRKHLLSPARQRNYNRHLATINRLLAENASSGGGTKSANRKQTALTSLRYRLASNGPTGAIKLIAKRYNREYGNLPANLRHLL